MKKKIETRGGGSETRGGGSETRGEGSETRGEGSETMDASQNEKMNILFNNTKNNIENELNSKERKPKSKPVGILWTPEQVAEYLGIWTKEATRLMTENKIKSCFIGFDPVIRTTQPNVDKFILREVGNVR